MTYCLAWKKEKNIFMIADSAVSKNIGEVSSQFNSFGEAQGLYGNYIVEEGLLKIYKISEDMVISFAGMVDLSKEIINYIYEFHEKIGLDKLKKDIENTYEGCEVEIIIAASQNKNKKAIYYFNGRKFEEVDRVEIGNGKDIANFSQDINSTVDYFYKNGMDRNDYLAIILSVIQCYALKNGTFSNGVGGVFSGIIFDSKVRWFRDLEYYFFKDDIRDGTTLSVITRRDSVFSSSDLDGCIRYFLNTSKDNMFWNDLYYRSSIAKSLNTKNAYYYVFYSKKYNVIAFLKVNGQTQNIHFRRWMRRNKKSTRYEYIFSEHFVNSFETFNSSEERLPTLMEFEVKRDRYMSLGEAYMYIRPSDIKRVDDIKEPDFDFNEMEYKNYNISLIKDVKKDIDKYHNILLIDFTYFCDAIYEKITLYSPYRECPIENLNLGAIVDAFLKHMVPDEFIKFRVVVIKDKNNNRKILGSDMKEFFLNYSNCSVIESESFTDDFCGTVFQIMKNFYLNDAFFHLDKYIIMADNKDVNDLLIQIVPKFNFKEENPDIILVRNLNGITNMYGAFRYIVIDYLVVAMLGIPWEEFYELEYLVYDSIDEDESNKK